jgi:hypothetical protein
VYLILLGVVKFSDFGVQAFRLANLKIWTPKIKKPTRVEYIYKKHWYLVLTPNGGMSGQPPLGGRLGGP